MHHLVDIVARHNQGIQYVGTVLSLLQVELGAAYGHIVAVLHKVMDALAERQQLRTAVNQCDVIH